MGQGLKVAALGLALLLAACAPKPPPTPAPTPAVVRSHVTPAPRVRVVKVPLPLPPPRPATAAAVKRPIAVLPEPGLVPKSAPKPAAKSTPAVPPGAVTYAPVLVDKQRAVWPQAPQPWTLGGLVEQESCTSLKSAKCWNPRAELKTYREYGFGLGQITVAYRDDGSERFNKFTELQREYASLRDWRWADRYDAGRQLTAVVEMTHGLWRRVPPAADAQAQWAFTLSSYNGGLGGLLQDRRMCANSAGCDVTRWFGNIETHSVKSRAPQKAYGGQSWFSINRGYVRNVLNVRRAKYRQFWE